MSDKTYDILIVGGGIAGLYSGVELLRHYPKKRIGILEKYNYWGGRVVTYHKYLPGVGHVQWENGAGRISNQHILLHKLLRRYHIETLPLSSTHMYLPNYGDELVPNTFEKQLQVIRSALQELSPTILRKHTIRDILESTWGSKQTREFLEQFPYRGEVDILRADLGLKAFSEDMRSYEGFTYPKKGMDSTIHCLVNEFQKRGGILIPSCSLEDVSCEENMVILKTMLGAPKLGNSRAVVTFQAPKVILALHWAALKEIPALSTWKTLDRLSMFPLLRVYAVFPVRGGRSWFSDIPRFSTPGSLRYFIPMDPSRGIVMLSYTDATDAKPLIDLFNKKGTEALQEKLMSEIRHLFPDKKIPDALFFKAHPWTYGETYWLPGDYDAATESEAATYPFPKELPGVYVCGESFSLRQAWQEGALEHATLMLEKHFDL